MGREERRGVPETYWSSVLRFRGGPVSFVVCRCAYGGNDPTLWEPCRVECRGIAVGDLARGEIVT